MTKKNQGKILEEDIESSSNDQGIFYFRVRDVNLPPDLRNRIRIPQNKYDCLLYSKGCLFPTEIKSRKAKSISLDESMIKQHQLDSLEKATSYEGVIPGLILNFRVEGNPTYFIHITDFLDYLYIAKNQIKDHPYKSKVNKSSIPLGICEEIGIRIPNVQKRVRYRYYINEMIDKAIEKFKDS